MPIVIKWPTGARVNEVAQGFKEFAGIENVIGAIDGSHIPILGQGEHNDAYINREHRKRKLVELHIA